MGDFFGDRLIKGLGFLASDLCWMKVTHECSNSNLTLPPLEQFFFDHLLPQTIDFLV